MKVSFYAFILFSFLIFELAGQNITAFTDNNGKFTIFDDGNFTQAESQPPMSFKIGNNCVAYLDVNQNFKIYYRGEIVKPYDDMIITNYEVTNNLVLFTVGNTSYVFDNGNTVKLIKGFYNQTITDSLVVAQDYYTSSLQVYYRGKLTTLATPNLSYQYVALKGNKGSKNCYYRATKNILAYLVNDSLKVFWNGQTWNVFTITRQPNMSVNAYNFNFEVGKNIACYIDPLTKSLVVFYKGEKYILSSGTIAEIQTGDDMISYRDSTGLNVFYAGKKFSLDELKKTTSLQRSIGAGSFSSTDFLKDSVMLFIASGRCKVFNKENITMIDAIKDGQFKINGNTLAWLGKQNELNAFYNNNTYTLSTLIRPADFEVHGNTVWFSVYPNNNKVFYKGKIYDSK